MYKEVLGMAVAKKCDVCGKFFDFHQKEDIINAFSFQHNDAMGNEQKKIKSYELCSDCVNAINAKLKELKD